MKPRLLVYKHLLPKLSHCATSPLLQELLPEPNFNTQHRIPRHAGMIVLSQFYTKLKLGFGQ
jgi:hypothetical protein